MTCLILLQMWLSQANRMRDDRTLDTRGKDSLTRVVDTIACYVMTRVTYLIYKKIFIAQFCLHSSSIESGYKSGL